MIAYCGITCSECPVFIATQKDDASKRAKIAESWSKEYGLELKPEDIYCDGCLVEKGRLFKYCEICKIRDCAKQQSVDNCAHCSEFACRKLDDVFNAVPAARQALQDIKNNL